MPKDLSAAHGDPRTNAATRARHPAVRRRFGAGARRFVTMTGGEYFFSPSISAVRMLATA
jgi:hypothetical protein